MATGSGEEYFGIMVIRIWKRKVEEIGEWREVVQETEALIGL